MFFLWSAYLLADSTAIYTLGHLSVDSRSDEHELVAFWAPFLLMHLGGPDNITAYALEDNTLWLRHLQTLAVQVLGAAYVIYEYISRSGTLLLLASISMFVAGLLKYGERIWALKGRGWEWSLHVITSLGQRVHPASRRLWSGSIGQYNLFHLCTRNTNEIGNRLATKLGFQDWWNKMHFSGTFSHSDILSIQDIKKLVLQALEDKDRALRSKSTDSNSRGSFILKSMEAYEDFARWSVNIDFDESILVWHIATEVYIRKSKAKHAKELVEATEVLSNYMMFLLVVKPNMLPGAARHNIHLTSCEQLEGQCRASFGDKDNPVAPSPISWNPCRMFRELFHHDSPSCSRIPRREKLAQMAWSFSQFALGSVRAPDPHGDSIRDSANMYAILLANELLSIELRWKEQRDPLELILGVWVEMLLYAANHCSQESHARQLSNGCEFITIVSLLAHHFKYYSGVSRRTEDAAHLNIAQPILFHPLLISQKKIPPLFFLRGRLTLLSSSTDPTSPSSGFKWRATAPPPAASVLALPDEIWEDIFLRLDAAADLVRASVACTQFLL
nr:unnamed protein product [Digitaria exilis]